MRTIADLGLDAPVVQAGMGGGISRHELAAAVSEAGGLGTIAVNGAAAIRRELAAARALKIAEGPSTSYGRGWFRTSDLSRVKRALSH